MYYISTYWTSPEKNTKGMMITTLSDTWERWIKNAANGHEESWREYEFNQVEHIHFE